MSGGVFDVGVSENMIGWALDEFNADLVSPAMKARLDEIMADFDEIYGGAFGAPTTSRAAGDDAFGSD